MSDADEVTFDAPTTPPKKKRRSKPSKAKAEPAAVPFPGLTRTACADKCGVKGCVISEKSYCAHPTKGGLHPSDMSNQAALKRLQKAREQIGVRVDPDRFK